MFLYDSLNWLPNTTSKRYLTTSVFRRHSKMETMVVSAILFSLLVLQVQSISEAECEYKVDLENGIHADRRLMNHVFLNKSVNHPMLCFSKCVSNCFCESFNFCGNKCELSSSTKESSAADYKTETNCKYYDIKRVDQSEVIINEDKIR